MNTYQEEEEDDYMSSAFLEQAEVFEKNKQQKTYTQRRRDQLREQQKKAYIKPRKQLEEEAREEGLKKQLDQSNKGFKMLMKMGYKQGTTLGSSSQKGLQEPISVDIKQDRIGLGLQNMMKRKRENEEKEARKKAEQEPELFREAMAEKAKTARRIREITAAVHICEKLDNDHDIDKNILWCLLPKKEEEDDEKENDNDEHEHDDDDDGGIIKSEDDDSLLNEKHFPKEEVEALRSLKLDDQLNKLVEYLRSDHAYCFWCAAKYNNMEDLETNCPGPAEDEH